MFDLKSNVICYKKGMLFLQTTFHLKKTLLQKLNLYDQELGSDAEEHRKSQTPTPDQWRVGAGAHGAGSSREEGLDRHHQVGVSLFYRCVKIFICCF